jgi:Fic family protein
MKYHYGDHPTKKELLVREHDSKKAHATWNKLQKEWRAKSETLALVDKKKKPFWFVITPYLLDLMTSISEKRGFLDALRLSAASRKKLESKAISYEAYYSSHIEGAQSSLDEALRFIKKKQKHAPDESLQMIGNNQRAVEYAIKQAGKPITHELICRLQDILTEHTHLERPITRGEYRHGPVYIVNGMGQVVYEGPPHDVVPVLMENYIQWINARDTINPLIKAGIVHFYFVHVHPFDDGNGRTARALSNLVLADLGFKFINMTSLSSYFDHKRPQYYRAIQDVRAHDYDLTYFLIFFMEALLVQIEKIKDEIERESKVKKLKELISPDIYSRLKRRHVKALRTVLQTGKPMTTRKYCKINKCSDETARRDFLQLMEWGIFEAVGEGRSRGYKLSRKA